MIKKKNKTASDVLQGVVDDNHGDYLSFLEIKMALHERGFGLLMLFFALPLALVPPGLTAIPAIPLIIFSIQMIKGMDSPWLPKWVAKKTIKRSTIATIIEKAAPYLRKIEKLMRPRFSFASSHSGERVVGFFSLVFSISILIPLPLTNLIPSIGILLMSLGLLSKDGIPIIAGMIVGSFGVSIPIAIVFLGKKAVMGFLF